MNNPITQLVTDRQTARSLNDSNADICFLALSDENSPSVRTLVVREISDEGVTLFINKTSPKWHTLSSNSEAEILLWYPSLQRQYRIHGFVNEMSTDSISQNWPRKPAGSKYLDYAYQSFSPQSQEISSRQALQDHIGSLKTKHPEDSLTTPPIALGITLTPTTIESLDLNAHDRIHDRQKFTRTKESWHVVQLMP